MEAVFDHLVLEHPLSWKVTERVVAEWTDHDSNRRRQLGSLNSKTNPQSGPNLTLAVGCRDNSLLIALHIAVKLRPSTSSKPKHMYFVIPTESLLRPPSCDVLEHTKIPEATLCALLATRDGAKQVPGDNKSDAVELGAPSTPKRVIRMRLELADAGYVIMPQSTTEREIQGSPRRLLEDLRSLSNSRMFDIYLRFNTFAEVGLRHAAQKVRSGLATTPTVHIDRMFNGIGAISAWDQYQLPPPYKANPPVDKFEPVSVLVPRSSDASPVKEFHTANADEAVVEETPPPPLQPPRVGKRKATSPPPPPEPPRVGKQKDTSPPLPTDVDFAERLRGFHSLLCLWLEWAWKILPDAHEVVRDDLISLGRAICAADQPAIARLRAQCTKGVIFAATDRGSAAGCGQQHSEQPRQQRDLEKEFQDLVQWINHADEFADMVLSPKLFTLAKAVRGGDLSTFVHVKAECIVTAITLRAPQ